MEKKEHLSTVGGNVNWYSQYRKQYEDFFKLIRIKLHGELPYDPTIPLLDVYLKNMKTFNPKS